MTPLPTTDIRSNRGTWVVGPHRVPAIAAAMLDSLPAEQYDPRFMGQAIQTAYFDDRDYTLRKARVSKSRYLTLRVRCYQPATGPEVYAISAKTESEKWRQEITAGAASGLLSRKLDIVAQLPAHIAARINELSAGPLVPVVMVHCHRYAVEDEADRLTIDIGVSTDRHKQLTFNVLEFKSSQPDSTPARIAALQLPPLKLSKFLWATRV
jgi:hypothetical protein